MVTGLSFRFGGPSSLMPGPSGYVSMSQYQHGRDREKQGWGCQVALNQAPLRGLVITDTIAEWGTYSGVQETWV